MFAHTETESTEPMVLSIMELMNAPLKDFAGLQSQGLGEGEYGPVLGAGGAKDRPAPLIVEFVIDQGCR
ncbi:MAG: hypothetical protein ACK57G_14630 [Planctomycetota bacterium]